MQLSTWDAPSSHQKDLAASGVCVALGLGGIMMCIPTALELWRAPTAMKALMLFTQGGWILYLFFLAAHALKSSRFWSQSAASNLVFAFGVALPLIFAGLSCIGLGMGRGWPCVEAIIITGFLVRLQLLPLRAILAHHLLFLTITVVTYHVRTLPEPYTSGGLAWCAFSVLANFVMPVPLCCVMALARNRHTNTRAARYSEGDSTRRGAKRSGLLVGKLLRDVERKLLEALPEEEAEAWLAALCAAIATAVFLGCCINYNVPNTFRPSPTMEMLAIMSGMFWGSSDAQHLKHLAAAQHRAYSTVRTLLHGMIPSHVAKRLEAMETERGRLKDKSTGSSSSNRRWTTAQLLPQSLSQHLPTAGGGQGGHIKRARRALSETGEEKIKTPRSCKFDAAQAAAAAATALAPPGQGLANGNTAEQPATSPTGNGALRVRRSRHQLAKPQQQLQPLSPVVRTQSGAAAAGVETAWEGPQPRPRPPFLIEARDQQNGNCPISWESNTWTAMPSPTEIVTETGTSSTMSGSLDQSQRFEDPLSCSEKHESVTVMFSDIVGFTSLSEQLQPTQVMAMLGDLYSKFDDMANELQVYTIDTIGDCYMCAANLIQPLPNHAVVMAELGQRMIQIANSTITPLGTPLVIRVGIHTGPLMSGILGSHRMKFTLVGDTVNVASRMESTALPNTIQVSSETYELLHLPGIVPWQAAGRCSNAESGPSRHRLAILATRLLRGSSTSLPLGHRQSREGYLSGVPPKHEGMQSLDSPRSNVTEPSGRDLHSWHHSAKGGEDTPSAGNAPSNLVDGQEGGQPSMNNSTKCSMGVASSREGAQQANDSRTRRPPMRKSGSGTQRAASLMLEQAMQRRTQTVGKAGGNNNLGPSRTDIGSVPLAAASGVGCASNWRARDLMVKGKGCMRAFYLSVDHQSANVGSSRSIEALTLSDD